MLQQQHEKRKFQKLQYTQLPTKMVSDIVTYEINQQNNTDSIFPVEDLADEEIDTWDVVEKVPIIQVLKVCILSQPDLQIRNRRMHHNEALL